MTTADLSSLGIVTIASKTSSTPGWLFALRDGAYNGMLFRAVKADSTTILDASPTTDYAPTIANGQWHHVAAVVSRASSSLNVTLYLDGKSIKNVNNSSVTDSLSSSASLIVSGSSSPFSGSMDDLRIHSRALQPYEIHEHFLAGR